MGPAQAGQSLLALASAPGYQCPHGPHSPWHARGAWCGPPLQHPPQLPCFVVTVRLTECAPIPWCAAINSNEEEQPTSSGQEGAHDIDKDQVEEGSWLLSAKGQRVHIQEMLSQGGVGWVFRGVSPGYGEVAVKVYMVPLDEQGEAPHDTMSQQGATVAREMAALRALQHPNVVKLLWGFSGDRRRPKKAPFLVLELLGPSLGSLLYGTQQALPLGQALKVGLHGMRPWW